MRESTVEHRLVTETKKRGGIALKFVSPGIDGVPDRLVLLPHGKFAFVEVKAPGRTLRPLQVRRIGQLRELGYLAYCLDHPDQIGGILDEIQSTSLSAISDAVCTRASLLWFDSGHGSGQERHHADGSVGPDSGSFRLRQGSRN